MHRISRGCKHLLPRETDGHPSSTYVHTTQPILHSNWATILRTTIGGWPRAPLLPGRVWWWHLGWLNSPVPSPVPLMILMTSLPAGVFTSSITSSTVFSSLSFRSTLMPPDSRVRTTSTFFFCVSRLSGNFFPNLYYLAYLYYLSNKKWDLQSVSKRVSGGGGGPQEGPKGVLNKQCASSPSQLNLVGCMLLWEPDGTFKLMSVTNSALNM